MNLRHLLQQDPPTTNANLSDELRSTLSPLPKDTLCHDHMHLPLHPLLHHSGWLQKPRPRCTARQTERMRSASNLISAGGTSRRSLLQGDSVLKCDFAAQFNPIAKNVKVGVCEPWMLVPH
eukprot:m.117129 g.117129  ORF g.117129 m.117129 type:complete len:121 (-) comp13176_c0_seq2:2347-2709(-)